MFGKCIARARPLSIPHDSHRAGDNMNTRLHNARRCDAGAAALTPEGQEICSESGSASKVIRVGGVCCAPDGPDGLMFKQTATT